MEPDRTAALLTATPTGPLRPAPKTFGPVAALIAVPLVAVIALVVAALASLAASSLLAPFGSGVLTGDDAPLSPDAVRLQRMDGLTVLFWGLAVLAVLAGLIALRRADPRRALAIGGSLAWKPCIVAAAVMIATFAAESWLAIRFPHLRELFTLPEENIALAAAILGAVVTAPIAEELLFRGLLYTALRERWGYLPALAVSSVLFSAMHIDPTGIYALLVFPSAVLFGWLRERTGGVRAPILAHAVFNLAAVVALLIERAAG